MLIDFDKTFSKPELQESMPDGYIDILNKTTPPHTHYERVEHDKCILTSDTGETMKIGGLVFQPTEKQREILGDNFTMEDFEFYLYNSQGKYQFSLKEPGMIIINGEKMPIEKMEQSLHEQVHFVDGKGFMSARPMDEEFDVRIGDGTIEQKIHMVRKSLESISEILFESSQENFLQVTMRINIKDESHRILYNINLGHFETIKDVVNSIKIYNAFALGEGYVDGKKLNLADNFKKSDLIDENDIIFFEKLLAIEENLNIQFVPPGEEIPMNDAIKAEVLYQSLIKKNPTIYKNRIDSLKGSNFDEVKANSIKSSLGKPIFFEFTRKEEFDLFGQHIELTALFSICNAILDNYIVEGESTELKLADESEEKKLFVTILLFNNVEELEEYRKGDVTERVKILQNAKDPIEYI